MQDITFLVLMLPQRICPQFETDILLICVLNNGLIEVDILSQITVSSCDTLFHSIYDCVHGIQKWKHLLLVEVSPFMFYIETYI